jgi:hypothetical protein
MTRFEDVLRRIVGHYTKFIHDHHVDMGGEGTRNLSFNSTLCTVEIRGFRGKEILIGRENCLKT